jgi:uroporphyrinogen-III synthase
MGVRSVLEPLYRIIFSQTTPELSPPYQALIFTSRNAVKAFGYRFPEVTAAAYCPAYCIGENTADAADYYGLDPVIAVSGDGRHLLEQLKKDLDPTKEPLFRVIAEGEEDPLAAQLIEMGFQVTTVPLYTAQPIPHLSRPTINALQKRSLDGVLFYAPRTASHFVQLVQQEEGLSETCKNLTAWCINELTADALSPLPFKNIYCAQEPTQASLIAQISATHTSHEGQENESSASL